MLNFIMNFKFTIFQVVKNAIFNLNTEKNDLNAIISSI